MDNGDGMKIERNLEQCKNTGSVKELIKDYELALKLMKKDGCSKEECGKVKNGIDRLKELRRNLGLRI